jgi:hypothetical protein
MLKRVQVYNGIRIELLLTNTKTKQTRRNQMRIMVTNKWNKYERMGLHLLAIRRDLLADMLDEDTNCLMHYRIKYKRAFKYIKAKDILL